jgi:hypothetical protein
MVGEEGEEEGFREERPGRRESGSRNLSTGMVPGSRGSPASHGLMNGGERDKVVGSKFGIMLGLSTTTRLSLRVEALGRVGYRVEYQT